MGNRVSIVVPALNEAEAIGAVVRSMPWGEPAFDLAECIVVDNGSADGTGDVAREAGARVVTSPRGYGAACWAGTLAAVGDVLVFMDGDGADTVEDFEKIVGPVLRGEADFCIGSRIRGRREPGSLSPPQVLAGHLIGWMVKVMYGYRYTDMGAFRAIRKETLLGLGMTEMTFGWNLEMQVRAVQCGLRIVEVPTDYKCRVAGVSKVSGDLKAAVKTVWRIAEVLVRTRKRAKAEREVRKV
jgi:glycosyltransferase involved in cell wall biosynthesis